MVMMCCEPDRSRLLNALCPSWLHWANLVERRASCPAEMIPSASGFRTQLDAVLVPIVVPRTHSRSSPLPTIQLGGHLHQCWAQPRRSLRCHAYKRLWGFAMVRYRGLAKSATRALVALGLAHIYLARARLRHECARAAHEAWLCELRSRRKSPRV